MAEHLTFVSLRRALSAQGAVSEKVADDFLSALFGSIQDGLQKDGEVTISGLGSFKLQDIPARESVNVATGERITIDGYKKVVFAASTAALNEPTNAKQSTRSSAEPIDPIQKLGEQAEEIKDILSELNAMSTEITEPQVTPVTPETPEVPVTPETPEAPETPETPEAPETPVQPEQQKKPFNPWLTGLITIGVFAMMLVIAYFILRHQIVQWADGMRTTIEQRVSAPESPVIPETPEQSEVQETPEPVVTPAAPVSPWFDDSQRKFTEFQRDETVGQDSRLAWIAKKRYGEKAYWVFIYEVNRDRLKAADFVLPGMKLRVPKLPKELSDPNDPDTKALLERLSDKYLNS